MQLHSCLWATVVKRHYLLRMKAKYAGKVYSICSTLFIVSVIQGRILTSSLFSIMSKAVSEYTIIVPTMQAVLY